MDSPNPSASTESTAKKRSKLRLFAHPPEKCTIQQAEHALAELRVCRRFPNPDDPQHEPSGSEREYAMHLVRFARKSVTSIEFRHRTDPRAALACSWSALSSLSNQPARNRAIDIYAAAFEDQYDQIADIWHQIVRGGDNQLIEDVEAYLDYAIPGWLLYENPQLPAPSPISGEQVSPNQSAVHPDLAAKIETLINLTDDLVYIANPPYAFFDVDHQDYQWYQEELKSKALVLRCGEGLPESLESIGADSSDLLQVLNCAQIVERNGFTLDWIMFKARLQRLAIQLRLPAVAQQTPAEVPITPGQQPPTSPISAPELAKHFRLNLSRVESRLRRLRSEDGDCYVTCDERQKNKPMYLYHWERVKLVILPMLES